MIFYKKHLKAHQIDFKNPFFTLKSASSCSEATVFSKACFFCCRYSANHSLIKKQHTFGIQDQLKRAFAARKLETSVLGKGFLADQVTNNPATKKREKKRSSLILPQHIGRVFFVHNGKTFSSIQIYRKMLGHKFGEFASTRKKPIHKKKR